MDSISFLKKVLPESGVRFACRLVPSKKNPRGVFIHEVANSHEQLIEICRQWEAKGGNIYFACASYREATYKTKTMPDGREFRYVTRGASGTVALVRSLWEDIDVGKADPGKSYDTRAEAGTALVRACKKIGVPVPMIVKSGKGIHCYWPFTKDVTYEQWIMLAEMKKAAFLHAGLKIDPSRAADVKSVLRPVGITGSTGKPVVVAHDAGPFEYDELFRTLQIYTATNTVSVHTPPLPSNINDELGVVEHPPSSAYLVADRCAQIREFRDLMGAVSYDLWWMAIGVLKHTREGEPICHEWSAGHNGYDYDETQSKIESWSKGPTSCAKLLGCNPSACAGCVYRGKVKGPLQLGYDLDSKPVVDDPVKRVPEQEANLVLEPVAELPKTFDEVEWPARYGVNSFGQPTVRVVDDTGVVSHIPFANKPFFIHEHILNTDFTRVYRIVYRGANGRWRTFSLEAELMADPRLFSKAFAAHEIFFFGKAGTEHGMALIRDLVHNNKRPETRQVKHMGWMYNDVGEIEDAFVIGKEIITPTSIHPVRVDEGLDSAIAAMTRAGGAFGARGTRNAWLDMVNRVYAREGAEAHQMVILAGFAAPIVELTKTDEWHGMPIALTGGSSAGKTKVCAVKSSIYGSPKAFVIGGGREGTTFMAANQMPAYACNLPLTFDEISGRPPEEVRDLLYQLPQGTEKIALTNKRMIRQSDLYWNTLEIITSNDDMYTLSSKFQGNIKTALQVRVFEARMPEDYAKKVWPDVNPKIDIDPVIEANYGVVGRDWIQTLIKNKAKIADAVRKKQAKLAPSSSGMESSERFYADLMATILVTGKLLVKMGWLQFDMVALEKWMSAVVDDNRLRRVDTGLTTKDKVSSIIRHNHDSILMTKGFDLVSRGSHIRIESSYEKPRRGVSVRIATEDKRLFIAVEAFDEWCSNHNVNKHVLLAALLKEGFLKNTVDLARRKDATAPCRVNLGKGTLEPTGQMRCYEFDYGAVFDDDLALDKVVHIENAREVTHA